MVRRDIANAVLTRRRQRPGTYVSLLRGSREIPVTDLEVRLQGRIGKTSVVADDGWDWEVGLADSTCEAGEQGGAIRYGANGAAALPCRRPGRDASDSTGVGTNVQTERFIHTSRGTG